MIALLAACGAPPPASWEGVSQAVVRPDGGVVRDRYVARRDDAGLVATRVDRCLGERCVLGPAARSVLMGFGPLLLEEEYTWEGLRSLSGIDAAELAKAWTVPLGREPPGLVPGGSLFADDAGVLLFANHGLSGVDVAEPPGVASATLDRWEGGALRFRRRLARYPDEAHHDPVAGVIAVHAEDVWHVFDARTGEERRAFPGRPGACLGGGHLQFLLPDEPALVDVDVATGLPTIGPPVPVPGWVAACVRLDGEPVFHGGLDDGGGWLVGASFERLDVPRVDRQLDLHVDADGRLWVVELGRGWVIVDWRARRVDTAPRELHDVIRAGPHLLAYSVGTDLRMTLTSGSGEVVLPDRLSPRPWHVAGDVLHTFPHRLRDGPDGGEVALRLPALIRVSGGG